jgi:branched-chain amino acid transport system ATP-binding protein
MTDQPVLKIASVDAGYRSVPVLRDIDFELYAGRVAAILGANGAGKSTLLRSITGATTITKGSISFNGHQISGRRTHQIARLGIAHVPEGRQIFGALTVEENLLTGAARYVRRDQARAKARLADVLDLFPALAPLRATRGGALSGGEQQMVVIGRALMSDPSVILIDEPSLGLAPKMVSLMYQKLDVLRHTGVSILVVEQNAALALRLADDTYSLVTGRLTAFSADSDAAGDAQRLREIYLGRQAPKPSPA